MTSQGNPYARFQRSLASGNPTIAMAAATELPRISIEDALALCRVLAQAGDARYGRAAGRWLERFASETGATLEEIQLAAGALAAMRAEPEADLAYAILDRLVGT